MGVCLINVINKKIVIGETECCCWIVFQSYIFVLVEVIFHYSVFIPFIVFCSSIYWRFQFYGMWLCVIGQVVCDILANCSAFRMSGTVIWMTQHHIPQDWNLQLQCCENIKSWIIYTPLHHLHIDLPIPEWDVIFKYLCLLELTSVTLILSQDVYVMYQIITFYLKV